MKETQAPKKLKGLAELHEVIELDKKAAKQLFKLTTEERGTTEEIRNLVTHGSILELIYMSIDMTRSAKGVVNQLKSRQEAKAAKERQQDILYEWLDKNLSRYSGQLDHCADVASKSLERKLSRAPSWVRKEITAYRKKKQQ